MKAVQNIPTSFRSIPELVFLNRNKEYGAYVLRRTYNQHMTEALFVSVLLFIATVMLPSIFKKEAPAVIKNITKPGEFEINLGTVSIEQVIPKFPVSQSTSGARPSIRFVVPNIVPDATATGDASIPTTGDLIGKTISTVTKGGDPNGAIFIPIEPIITPTVVNTTKTEDVIYDWTETLPTYPGGNTALFSFISANVIYPEIARRASVQGKVSVQFVIEKDGSVSNINVIKGIGAGCDEEAVRVIQSSGRWIPGSQNGKAVRVKMVVPFVFKLS